MKKVIIAEKPSYALACAQAISLKESISQMQGYYESDHYFITYAFGHLFELDSIDQYMNREKAPWRLEELPFIPTTFKFHLKNDNGVQKQYKIIKELINRADVDTIINCGDADREGEIIIRLIIQAGLENNKKIMRLWSPDQTEESILNCLDNLIQDEKFDNLANEGFARTYIDWLLGINLTRYLTLRAERKLVVGRVLIPIVKAIYDRDMEIKEFVPETYYVSVSHNELDLCIGIGERMDKDAAERLSNELNRMPTIVSKVQKKQVVSKPPKLFSQTKLQAYLGKKMQFPPEKTLEIVQKLYECKYVSYPRTNSEYLATGEKEKIEKVLSNLQKQGYSVKMKQDKSIFDDSKVESHSALIPTYKIPARDSLSEDENIVYEAIRGRFTAVFCSTPCIVSKTIIELKNGHHEFKLEGKVIEQKGWMTYDNPEIKDKYLPVYKENEIIKTNFEPEERKTSPPRHYTVASLLTFLEKPFTKEKKNADEIYKLFMDGVTIGTEATRADTIKKAINMDYVAIKNGSYYVKPLGIELVKLLDDLQINLYKDKTIKLNKQLIAVNRQEVSVNECIEQCAAELIEIVRKGNEKKIKSLAEDIEIIGRCPLCHSQVYESRNAYRCSKNIFDSEKGADRCFFFLNKQTKFCDMKITPEIAKSFLKKGYAKVSSLNGKKGKFSATVKINFESFTKERPFPSYELVYKNKRRGKK